MSHNDGLSCAVAQATETIAKKWLYAETIVLPRWSRLMPRGEDHAAFSQHLAEATLSLDQGCDCLHIPVLSVLAA